MEPSTWNHGGKLEVGQVFSSKTDGSLWWLGCRISMVELVGLNQSTYRSSPTQVGTATDWGVVLSTWYIAGR